MSPVEKDYIAHRLARARGTLDEARLMLEHGYLNGAVNRLYYACFYAVSALLMTGGLSSARHSGVISLFDREWIRTGRLPVEVGRIYHTLFEWRQKGDYQDLVRFDPSDVAEWLSKAEQVVALVSAKVDAIVNEDDN